MAKPKVNFEGDYFGVISIVVSPTESADGAAKRKVRQKTPGMCFIKKLSKNNLL